ncbi:MAG: hypothetical protein GAK28_02967 [Luteibacter sp.]|nr:MAG: hypothetical protein GAK28_02967 [Luteibacter sp.]
MRHRSGSSLIECLVALAVFAVGTGCHATWLAHSLGVHARASRSFAATTLAVSLAERMRRNPEGLREGLYAKAANFPECQVQCENAALAMADLQAFHDGIGRHLGPRGQGRVDCPEPRVCVIRIAWAGQEELAWRLRLGA